jgi:hypothetical protein
MFGDSFLNYADNYRLWLNAVAWLLDEKRLADPKPYRQWRKPLIAAFDASQCPEFGDDYLTGSYRAFVFLSRYYWIFATDQLDDPCDLMVFANNEVALSEAQAASVAGHLAGGRNVLILNARDAALLDETSLVGRMLRAEAARGAARRSKKDRVVFEWPKGGAIHVLGPDTVMDNRTIGSPTEPPNDLESAAEKRLLEAARDALSPGGRR